MKADKQQVIEVLRGRGDEGRDAVEHAEAHLPDELDLHSDAHLQLLSSYGVSRRDLRPGTEELKGGETRLGGPTY